MLSKKKVKHIKKPTKPTKEKMPAKSFKAKIQAVAARIMPKKKNAAPAKAAPAKAKHKTAVKPEKKTVKIPIVQAKPVKTIKPAAPVITPVKAAVKETVTPKKINAATAVQGRPQAQHFPVNIAPTPIYPSELPDNYGDNHIYIMVRDPHWIFSYWEIQKDHQEKALAQLGGSWNVVNSILRVYDTTGSAASFYDIVLSGMVKTWYLNSTPDHSYHVEIGLLHRDGRFIMLARSNSVRTPRAGMSEVIDEKWMGIDFDTMYALSGGFKVGQSSMALQKQMEEQLAGAVSSGSGMGLISSMSSPMKAPRKRGFWFVLDCELIVYGATEPDAKVTLQGREIKLRPDGTFSLRFALPDGYYHLDAHAESADGIEERIIIPIVQRKTETPEPIIKKQFDTTA